MPTCSSPFNNTQRTKATSGVLGLNIWAFGVAYILCYQVKVGLAGFGIPARLIA